MKKYKKAFLIFSAFLNIVLAAVIFFGALSYKSERSLNAERAEAKRLVDIIECKNMLSRSLSAYAGKKTAESRSFLKTAQYIGSANAEFSSLCGAGDYCFFENGEDLTESDFAVFTGALDAIIEGRELTDGEADIAEKILTDYGFSEFEPTSYPYIALHADVDLKKAKRTAAYALGKNVAIEQCENSHFPLLYTFAGGNTYAALSVQGGKIIELMFYPGDVTSDIGEEKAGEIMLRFLRDEKFPEMRIEGIVFCDGMYYARLISVKYPSLSVVMAVGGVSGRVCMFDAENFYRGYGKR